jgi:two-component system response regulator AtoC
MRGMHHRPTDLEAPRLGEMIGRSVAMQRAFEQLRRAARSDLTILLRGESGTGKELAARAIHSLGRRRDGPFQAVNCATFTSELLASRLFGHVKGAFTGAVRDREGVLELANGGTLFLDEVAEIPPDLQGRLLRVLQERRFTPVGGRNEREVDIRILSATNASLRQRVAARAFREDLMFRLRVAVIRLPPLRERAGDLELLTWRFIDALNRTEARQIEGIDDEAWDAMCAHSWPGNVRELQNVLQGAFVLGEGPILTLDELSPEMRGEGWELAVTGGPDAPDTETLDDRERAILLEVWEKHGGRRGDMAEAMGWSRSTLYRKLKHHGLT